MVGWLGVLMRVAGCELRVHAVASTSVVVRLELEHRTWVEKRQPSPWQGEAGMRACEGLLLVIAGELVLAVRMCEVISF